MSAQIGVEPRPVVHVESAHALPLVSISVSFRTGALHDPEGKEGLARFTARMLRRGTQKRSSRALEAAIDSLGGELSVEVSVSTVSVHAQVIRRNLEPFLDLLAEFLGQPAFAEDELEKFRREVLAELIEVRDNDRALAQLAFRKHMFAGHPFGRSTHGRPRTIEAIRVEDVRDFYSSHFTRGNAVFGFAQDVRRDEAERIAARLRDAIPEASTPEIALGPPPRLAGRRLIFVDKPERTQTQIQIGALGTSPHDEDHVPLAVAVAIFGGTFTSRLMKEIRSKRGWSYGASARIAIERQRHAFSMSTFPAAADAAPCLALELSMLEQLVADGVTARETSFARNYLVRSHAFEIDTAPKRLQQALDVDLLDLPPDYHTRYLPRVRQTTSQAATLALKSRLFPEELVIVVVGTASEILDAVQKSIPRLAGTCVLPFDSDD